jgi:hypothetical protein
VQNPERPGDLLGGSPAFLFGRTQLLVVLVVEVDDEAGADEEAGVDDEAAGVSVDFAGSLGSAGFDSGEDSDVFSELFDA